MRPWLTGVGAMTIASALVFSVLFDLWSRGILQFPEGRPTFEVAGLPAYAFGAAVAVRAGGWRGLLPLVALASLWVVMGSIRRPGSRLLRPAALGVRRHCARCVAGCRSPRASELAGLGWRRRVWNRDGCERRAADGDSSTRPLPNRHCQRVHRRLSRVVRALQRGWWRSRGSGCWTLDFDQQHVTSRADYCAAVGDRRGPPGLDVAVRRTFVVASNGQRRYWWLHALRYGRTCAGELTRSQQPTATSRRPFSQLKG
jgi:hypothetical protein